MTALRKDDIVAFFCYCGQARGSIDRLLTAPGRWLEFVAYYDDRKRDCIRDLIGLLQRSGALSEGAVNRDSFSENVLFAAVWSLAGPLINKGKKSWSFSQKQLSFFCVTLQKLLRILQLPQPPGNKELAELRVDFHRCQTIVGRKLLGVRELGKATRIEHFGPSEFLEYVTLQQMGAEEKEFSI